jgi:hypothetical protein
MNERILEIAKQCDLLHTLPNGNLYPTFMTADQSVEAYQKFAELIVKECALIAGLMEHERRKGIGAQILDNFGVEE